MLWHASTVESSLLIEEYVWYKKNKKMVNDDMSFIICLTIKCWYKTTSFFSVFFKFVITGSLKVKRSILYHLLKKRNILMF